MISQKARYSIKALIVVAAAAPGEPLRTREIAQRGGNIPRSFLEQILLELKRHRFVESRRGKEGGFILARPASQITLGDILRVMDGPIAPLSCLSKNYYRRCEDCLTEETCSLRLALLEAFEAQVAALEQTTLADILAKTAAARGDSDWESGTFLGAYI
jgi:Rrf2 family protein